MTKRLVIVGGSYAASELAVSARANGYDDEVVILTDEGELPYHRPPLSKAYLLGTDDTALPLKSEQFYIDHRIEVRLNSRVTSADKRSMSVQIAEDDTLSFTDLALTVGASARTLPGAEFSNVFYLRSLRDASRLKKAAAGARQVAIIGGGFIGLEVASALVQQGCQVTVLESGGNILTRVVAPVMGDFFLSAHRARGVEVRTRIQIARILGDHGVAKAILLEDGSSVGADIIVIGIGSVPNRELADALNLDVRNGIFVDSASRTSCENVYAAGDCTFFRSPFAPSGIRLESVQNAVDQARVAGACIAGKAIKYSSLPWFWSDQYKFKLQIVGLSHGYDEHIVKNAAEEQFSVYYFNNGVCIAVDSVNRARDHMAARRLLQGGGLTKALLQSVDFDLSALLKQQGPPS